MPLLISDDLLSAAGMSEDEARIEIACRLFDAGKLALWPAAKWAGLSRVEFEDELRQRKIPLYRPTVADLQADLATFERLDAGR